MGNEFIKGLYDMAGVNQNQKLTASEEIRFKKALESNETLFKQNKDIFAQNEPKFLTCKRYMPCPVCHKCKNKASHMFIACQTCTIPICRHTYADAKKLIKRAPFTIRATSQLAQLIRSMEKEMTNNE